MATSPYEDDYMSTGSGRTQMSDPYEDRESFNLDRAMEEGRKISEGERVSNMPASEKMSAPKPKIVTKEELDKSGLSLRDYMNKQQGLTRRGESTPAAKPAAKPSTSPVDSVVRKKPVTTADTFNANSINNFAKPKAKAEEEKPKSTYKKNATSAPSGRNPGKSKSSGGNDVDFGGTGLGMKKGGMVSSASRRGDGIAQRGKTRGKMC